MPRKKGVAYQARLARVKAQRRIRNLEANIKTKYRGKLQQEAQLQLADYKRAVQQTMMRDETGRRIEGRTEMFVREQVQRLERMNRTSDYLVNRGVNRQQVEMLKQQLNLASGKQAMENPMERVGGEFSAVEKSVFFKATQRLWEGAGAGDRLSEITRKLRDYGITDIYDFAKSVVARYEPLISRMASKKLTPAEQSELERKLRDSDDTGNKKYEKYPSLQVVNLVESMSISDLAYAYLNPSED